MDASHDRMRAPYAEEAVSRKPTLTDEEREALEQAIWRIEHHYQPGRAVTLRALLERLG